MIDPHDVFVATRDGVIDAHEQLPQYPVLPLRPFRAHRTIGARPEDEDPLDAVNVVGIRFDTAEKIWRFVYVAFDGDSEVYVEEAETLTGQLPNI